MPHFSHAASNQSSASSGLDAISGFALKRQSQDARFADECRLGAPFPVTFKEGIAIGVFGSRLWNPHLAPANPTCTQVLL